jgi:tRNA uridine 5-carboxymethylaminomethyl modification enzyme
MNERRSDDAAVIVVGGGHAGVEAAHAAAAMGVETMLVTGDPERICTLACNPSIGGSAKGQLVREIDALGGAMARIIDACSLHARFLNESKGPAVRALRAQADKASYVRVATATLRSLRHLTIVRGLVADLLIESGVVRGVVTQDGIAYRARRVILATGTFLGGKIYRGEHSEAAGRVGEPPALALADSLRAAGFPTGRLKTGTPPRVAAGSVDYTRMRVQPPSSEPLLFSYRSARAFAGPQLDCHVVTTNARTHALVRDNLHRSPLYGLDLIRGIGPRYCPSIEDKVVKFAHNPAHLIFIEPEGWETDSLYVGGFSTSLPGDVQLAMLRTLPGICGGIRLCAADATPRVARDAPRRRAVPCRTAERHVRLRRGGRARTHRRHQCRSRRARSAAGRPRTRRCVRRRARRRPGHARRRRTVSDAQLPRGAPRRVTAR